MKQIYKDEVAGLFLDTYCKIIKVDRLKILSWAPVVAGARLGEYVKDEREERILGLFKNPVGS
jgi:hypothetical protein